MSDNTQDLDEILNEVTSFDVYKHPEYIEEAKQAIIDWHNKRKLEARVDTLEFAKISPKFKIEEKIEQLRLEMRKYE